MTNSKDGPGLLWYYRSDQQEVGPINEAGMQALLGGRVVTDSTLVRVEGTSTWLMLRDSALGNLMAPAASNASSASSGRSKTGAIVFGCLALAVLVAIIANWWSSPGAVADRVRVKWERERAIENTERQKRADQKAAQATLEVVEAEARQGKENEKARLAANEAAKLDAERAVAQAERIKGYAAKTSTERISLLAKACADDCDQAELEGIIGAAANANERSSLRRAAAALLARQTAQHEAVREKAAVAQRREAADALDDLLLANHMNPDGVTANGKTCTIRGWFCSRQFLHDFSGSPGERLLADAGFTKLVCSSALETWTQEL